MTTLAARAPLMCTSAGCAQSSAPSMSPSSAPYETWATDSSSRHAAKKLATHNPCPSDPRLGARKVTL